jgi:hypothetical protein
VVERLPSIRPNSNPSTAKKKTKKAHYYLHCHSQNGNVYKRTGEWILDRQLFVHENGYWIDNCLSTVRATINEDRILNKVWN